MKAKAEINLMNAIRKEEIYTTDDIYALPDGERAELIDGKIYYTKHRLDLQFIL